MGERMMDGSTAKDYTPARRATILLVEDEERVRGALYVFLLRRGYEVIDAGTVVEAEKCMAALGSENIAVVVCDLNQRPGSKELEGYVLFQRWTAEHTDLPFILISGDHSGWDPPAVRSGAVRFLAKPFNVYDLLAAVRSVLRE